MSDFHGIACGCDDCRRERGPAVPWRFNGIAAVIAIPLLIATVLVIAAMFVRIGAR